VSEPPHILPPNEPNVLPASEPAVAEPPRRRGVRRVLTAPIARYVSFVVRHRFLGCLASLFLLLFLCGGVSVLAVRLMPGSGDFAPLDELDVNDIGTVINESEDPVDAYIQAMENFDAQGMWDAYNDQAKTRLTSQGADPKQLQQGLDQAKNAGARYLGAERIGNYQLRDGRRYVFYILSRTGFPPNGGDEEVYFIFTVDPTGQILNVT